jgi:hypothetical protein
VRCPRPPEVAMVVVVVSKEANETPLTRGYVEVYNQDELVFLRSQLQRIVKSICPIHI